MASYSAMESTAARNERPAVNIFVVRRWQVDGAETRYEIAHVRSGRRAVVADDTVAADWIGGFARDERYHADRASADRVAER